MVSIVPIPEGQVCKADKFITGKLIWRFNINPELLAVPVPQAQDCRVGKHVTC